MNEAMSEALIPVGQESLEVSATTPLEMANAQTQLVAWCIGKIESMKREAAELAENLAIAVRNKWSTATLRRHSQLAIKRVDFYEKIKAALEAGYCIVPNFPITMFAIRTDKSSPAKKCWIGKYESAGHNFEQDPKMLPAGEGDYKNPNPMVATKESQKCDETGKSFTQYTQWASDWDTEIMFPIEMAKPTIMEATSRAMQMKVFDQIGVLLPQAAKADPLIVGEILDPRPVGYGIRKRVAFIIGWHLDVRDL